MGNDLINTTKDKNPKAPTDIIKKRRENSISKTPILVEGDVATDIEEVGH